MTPYQFRPGPLSAADAAALTNLARMTRGNDGLMVRPPLSLVRQGSDGQAVLFLNGGSDYFFAQLTSGTSPYSWVERVETAAGTWANGPRSGTTNAYQVQPSSGTPSTPAANDVVVMRASPTVGGAWEFVLADKAGGGGALNSQNTDGTQVDATTTDLRLDKTTGVQVTQGSGGTANQSIVSGITATPTQVGMVSTGTQVLGGEKRFNGAIVRTAATSAGASVTSQQPRVVEDVTATTAYFKASGVDANNPNGVANPETFVMGTVVAGASAEARLYACAVDPNLASPSYFPTQLYETYSTSLQEAGMKAVALSGVSTSAELYASSNYLSSGNARVTLILGQGRIYQKFTGTTIEPGVLHCDTNFEIDGSSQGLIMTSPNGNRWRLGVNNAGALTITGPL